MAEYHLDTSLAQDTVRSLDPFTLAYIEAMMWTLTDEDGHSMDHLGLHDIAPETIERLKVQCADFQAEYAHWLKDSDPSQAGHDFWLTRNHHGVGYWDRSEDTYPNDPEGLHLTEAAHECGEINAYVGDDGMVYCD